MSNFIDNWFGWIVLASFALTAGGLCSLGMMVVR
jgi:hypothetical protein